MKSLEELNAEKLEAAEAVFVREQIRQWEWKARDDASRGAYAPPSIVPFLDLATLADAVYIVAWSRRRYKLSKEKRRELDKQQFGDNG